MGLVSMMLQILLFLRQCQRYLAVSKQGVIIVLAKVQGLSLKARDLVSGIGEIKSAAQAHSVLNLI